MSYWAVHNFSIVKGDTVTWSLTFVDADGTAVDVSLWVSHYKAVFDTDATDTLELTSAAGDITYSDSGSGTTDTVNVLFDDTDTGSMTVGKYRQHLRAVAPTAAGEPITKVKGTLTVFDEEAGP